MMLCKLRDGYMDTKQEIEFTMDVLNNHKDTKIKDGEEMLQGIKNKIEVVKIGQEKAAKEIKESNRILKENNEFNKSHLKTYN